ncbi:ABC transporter substrate-binding protein [Maridesulfovibrio hydrothermalis]|uniref:Extracellular ligand-binding receptor n=1 Tax=Maridesulfovibrio hydrothermalis AM13 = DSM 14728 TaxID=1121451 RepID=L0RDI3_9BACT|nr:ABC transporter substrate-binding protein [Maridesulfovibrio hydrothermalis]CCO23621.1 Extracellular ligand-binding receptor [Maridesulfovibrio hydrothermalis AM13 = DSM 14728]
MNRVHAVLLILLTFIALVVLTGCSDKKKSAASELKVGVVAVTSGELFRKGNYIVTAARYAADKINKEGGVEFDDVLHFVKLYPADSGGSSEIAAKVAQRLIEKNKVSVIVGGAGSEVALAVAEVCERYSVPFITPVAGTNKLTSYKYSFRVCYTNAVQGEALAQFTRKSLQQKPVGILYSSGSPYSAELARYFKVDYERDGGKVVAYESYTAGDRGFNKQLKRIIESGAQILFLPNNTKKVQLQAAQARKRGFKGILMGGDSWDPVDLERNPLFANSYYTDHWISGLPIEGSAEFENDFKKKTGAEPTELEALTYDAMMSMFMAIKVAKSAAPVAIHDALVDMPPYHGVTGNFDYNNNGDPAKDVIISTIRDGHIEVSDIIYTK